MSTAGPAPEAADGPTAAPELSYAEKQRARRLFECMLAGRPVWVNSPAQQQTRIEGIHLEGGRVVVYDADGQDRLVEDYTWHDPRAFP